MERGNTWINLNSGYVDGRGYVTQVLGGGTKVEADGT